MQWNRYIDAIRRKKIEHFGFDTHARVLGIEKDEVKKLWNIATGMEFKRVPRTEYNMRYMPELSSKFKPYWRFETPNDYLMFYLTPTTPILVPNGFITDKGSIPLPFQAFISIYDREMMMAFLVHDVECEMKRMTRFTVDGLLYEIGTEMQANWFKKNFVYTAVRLAAWRKAPDSIRSGFNVSQYNRDLIAAAEQKYLKSESREEHFDFVKNHHATIT